MKIRDPAKEAAEKILGGNFCFGGDKMVAIIRDAYADQTAKVKRLCEALQAIGTECEAYVRGSQFNCISAGRHKYSEDSMNRWCNACIARDALGEAVEEQDNIEGYEYVICTL